jgi:hypothetical protein
VDDLPTSGVNKGKYVLLIFILTAFISGLLFRIYYAFYQGIYVDEAAWLPISVRYFEAFFRVPQNLSELGGNALNPGLLPLTFGIIGFISTGFKLPNVVLYSNLLNYVPQAYLLDERLGLIILNTILIIPLVIWLYKKSQIAPFLFLILYWLNPTIIMDTTLMLPTSVSLPLTLLFYLMIMRSKLTLGKYGIISAILFGLMMSTQYYEIAFIILPILYYVFSFKSVKFGAFVKFFFLFLVISVLIFISLNPPFWHSPLGYLRLVLENTGFVSSTSSGVGGIPVIWLGSVTYLTPMYSIIVEFLLETPLIDLFLFAVAAVLSSVILYHTAWSRTFKNNELTTLALISFASFFVILGFAMSFPLFHGAVFLLILPVSLFVTVLGIDFSSDTSQNKPNLRGQNHHPIKEDDSANATKLSRDGRLIAVALLVIILFAALVPAIESSNSLPVYTNIVGDELGYGSGRLDGAWNSVQSDMYVSKYVFNHHLENLTILSLALTAMVMYYAPSNHYIQIWGKINASTLTEYHKGDLIVVDEWYAELWGNPVFEAPEDFNILYISYVNGGYSVLAEIK